MIVVKWADGDYSFQLYSKQLEELQRVCGLSPTTPIGIGAIADRLFNKSYFLSDIHHTIRLGLIGGGLDPVRAKTLMETYIEGKPLADPNSMTNPLALAQAIMQDAFLGMDALQSVQEARKEREESGEKVAVETKNRSTSRRSKSTRPASGSKPTG